MTAIACLGHWYVQLLFAVPSLGIIGWMTRDSLRKRRLRRDGLSPATMPADPFDDAELTDAELGLVDSSERVGV